MTIDQTQPNIKNVVDALTEQDFNNHEQLKQYPDIKKLIVTGLRSEIRNINNMSADDKFKERVRKDLVGLSNIDLNSHVKLFNKTILHASNYIINKAVTMGELINRLIPISSEREEDEFLLLTD